MNESWRLVDYFRRSVARSYRLFQVLGDAIEIERAIRLIAGSGDGERPRTT